MTAVKTWNDPWTDGKRTFPTVADAIISGTAPYAYYSAEYGQPKNVGYVELQGTSGDYIWTPDQVDLDIAGNIEVVCRIKAVDWTAAAGQTICGKYVTTGNQRSFRFFVTTAGAITLSASADGTLVTSVTITPTVALVDNTWYWMRLRLQLTNGANSVGTMEIADGLQLNEPASWTANGTATSTIITSVFAGTAPYEIGTFQGGTSERFNGQISRVILRDGFDGEVLSDFDARRCYGDGYYNDYIDYGVAGNRYVPLSGRSGDNIYTDDKTQLDIATDLDIIVALSAPVWASGGLVGIIAKDGASQRAFNLTISSSGELILYVSVDGINMVGPISTVPLPFANGSAGWIRVTRTISDGIVKYYTAPYINGNIPTTWTQLGIDRTSAVGPCVNVTSTLQVGRTYGTTGTSSLRIYRALVKAGIDGTTVADFDANLSTPFGYGDAYGNGWVIAAPKTKGVWTVGLPKIYDRSAFNRAPIVFGAGTNSPKYLTYQGNPYTYLPGIAGNQISASHAAGTIGDVDVWDVSMKIRPEAINIAQRLSGSSSTHFTLSLDSSNRLQMSMLEAGLSVRIGSALSLAVPGLTVGADIWVRGRVNRLTALCEYWYSYDATNEPDLVNWVFLSSGVGTNAGLNLVTTSTGGILIGTDSSGSAGIAGRIYAHKDYRLASDGTAYVNVWRASASGQGGGGSSNGRTTTLVRTTAGRKVVIVSPAAGSAKAVVSIGTDDNLDVANAAFPSAIAAATWSRVLTTRTFATPTSFGRPFDDRNGAGAGLSVLNLGTALQHYVSLSDGVTTVDTASASPPVYVAGQREVFTVTVNGTVDVRTYSNTNASNPVSTATVTGARDGSLVPAKLGRSSSGNFNDSELEDLISYNRVLSASEHNALTSLLVGGT